MEDRKLNFVDDFSAPKWYTILCLIMSKGRAGKDCPYEMLEGVPHTLQIDFSGKCQCVQVLQEPQTPWRADS